MRAWSCCLLLALGACGLGDDVADGSRAQCAEGGALNDSCANNITTAEQACWRMVDCGALRLHEDEYYRFDWSECVEEIHDAGQVQERLIVACVGASTCDQLKYAGGACFAYGGN